MFQSRYEARYVGLMRGGWVGIEAVGICNAGVGNVSPERHTGKADAANIKTTLALRDRKLIP